LLRNSPARKWMWAAAGMDAQETLGGRTFGQWAYSGDDARREKPGGETALRISYVAPAAYAPEFQGIDLLETASIFSALRIAEATGLPEATEIFHLAGTPGKSPATLIVEPVFAGRKSGTARKPPIGFVLATLVFESLLPEFRSDGFTDISLFKILPSGERFPLAATGGGAGVGGSQDPYFRRILPIFGHVYLVEVHAGQTFLVMHQLDDWWSVVGSGLLITAGLAWFLGFMLQRRNTLEKMVADRTQEIARNEELLRQKSLLEKQLLDISSTYLNMRMEDTDIVIEQSLGKIGRFVEADRVYLFDYDFEQEITINTHEWCAEGIQHEITQLQAVPFSMVTRWVESHQRGRSCLSRMSWLWMRKTDCAPYWSPRAFAA
jgi:hypothetical protein